MQESCEDKTIHVRKRVDQTRNSAYLARGSALCLFGGHRRAPLSDRGIRLDYARIKPSRECNRDVLFSRRLSSCRPSACQGGENILWESHSKTWLDWLMHKYIRREVISSRRDSNGLHLYAMPASVHHVTYHLIHSMDWRTYINSNP